MSSANPVAHRDAGHEVDPLFVRRHSPRQFRPAVIERAGVLRLFEAARWAPSTYNEQEWRFCYALRDTPHFDRFLEQLVEANRQWAKDAGLLAFVLSRTTFVKNGKPNVVHAFDAGAALQNLQLQAVQSGLASHAMGGIDRAGAAKMLGVPADVVVHCAVAVGHPAEVSEGDDVSFTGRKPLSAIMAEGSYGFDE